MEGDVVRWALIALMAVLLTAIAVIVAWVAWPLTPERLGMVQPLDDDGEDEDWDPYLSWLEARYDWADAPPTRD